MPPSLYVRILLLAASLFAVSASAQDRPKFGWLEKIKLFPSEIVINAKLDTGADYSSLNASELEEFEKGGKKWVRFSVTSRIGERMVIERPIVRVALIKRSGASNQKRLVVKLGICLGKSFMEADVNLVDRTQYTQQMLVGRNFLAGNAVVDPASSFTREPECKGISKS